MLIVRAGPAALMPSPAIGAVKARAIGKGGIIFPIAYVPGSPGADISAFVM